MGFLFFGDHQDFTYYYTSTSKTGLTLLVIFLLKQLAK